LPPKDISSRRGWFVRLLPFVPVAALTALTAPDLLLVNGGVELGLGNSRLWAGLVAIVGRTVAQYRAYHWPRFRCVLPVARRLIPLACVTRYA
jgi:hypothetical protein